MPFKGNRIHNYIEAILYISIYPIYSSDIIIWYSKCDWRRMTMMSGRRTMLRLFICLTWFQFCQSKVRISLPVSGQLVVLVVGLVCSQCWRWGPIPAVLQLLLQQVLSTSTKSLQHQQVQIAGWVRWVRSELFCCREKFVSSLLAEAVAESEEAPTADCVSWMCEESLVWLHYQHTPNLEVTIIITFIKNWREKLYLLFA